MLKKQTGARFVATKMEVKGDMADKLRAACDQRERLAVTGLIDADLLDGEVTVAVEHSIVNHKTNRHSPRSVCTNLEAP